MQIVLNGFNTENVWAANDSFGSSGYSLKWVCTRYISAHTNYPIESNMFEKKGLVDTSKSNVACGCPCLQTPFQIVPVYRPWHIFTKAYCPLH
jgi:hypothetical protein